MFHGEEARIDIAETWGMCLCLPETVKLCRTVKQGGGDDAREDTTEFFELWVFVCVCFKLSDLVC